MNALKLYYPVQRPRIAQKFGENLNAFYAQLGMKGHNGIDMVDLNANGAPEFPLYAAHDGVITFTGEDGSGGNGVVIRTNEQFDYNGTLTYFKTIYWHIKKGAFLVRPGDQVAMGQQIATGDNTGMSTGPHCHFGLKPIAQGESDWAWYNLEQNNGYLGAIDPAPYMQNLSAYQMRTTLMSIADILRKISDIVQKLLAQKNRGMVK